MYRVVTDRQVPRGSFYEVFVNDATGNGLYRAIAGWSGSMVVRKPGR